MLTDEQWKKREGKIGASFVPALMAADEPKILREWMRLTDHPAYERDDLSNVWAPSFGGYIEPFALDWHQKKTGYPLTRRGEWVDHPERGYIGCTLDAWRSYDNRTIDCKWIGAYRKVDEDRAFYTGQLIVQKACVQADRAALLVVYGGAEPVEYEAIWDEEYERQVWERIEWFWSRVSTLQPPAKLPAVQAPVPAIREVDMAASNTWAAAATDWLTNRDAARVFEASKGLMKELIEPDVAKAFGHGVIATRSKSGAISFKAG